MNPIIVLNRLFLAPVDARPYGLMRIGFACVSMLNLIALWPHRESLLSDTGMFVRDNRLIQFDTFSLFYLFHSPDQVDFIFALAAFNLLLFGLGYCCRFTGFLTWVWTISYCHGVYPALSASDAVFRSMSFLLMLSPTGAAYSLDKILQKSRRELCPLPLAYGLFMMKCQVSLIYVTTFLCKVPDPGWINGEVVGFFLLSVFMKSPLTTAASHPQLMVLLSYLTLAIEALLPFLLWSRRTRFIGFLLGWGLHGSILLLSRLELFSLVTMCSYLCFLESQDIEVVKNTYLKILNRFGISCTSLSLRGSALMEDEVSRGATEPAKIRLGER